MGPGAGGDVMEPKHWIVALGFVPVWWAASWIVLGGISLLTQGECYQPATTAGLWWARALLPAAALVMFTPWLAAAVLLRAWLLVPLGLAASGVTAYWTYAVWVADAAHWTNYNLC